MKSIAYFSVIGYHRGARQRAQHICRTFVKNGWNAAFIEPGLHNPPYFSDHIYVCSPIISPKRRLPSMQISLSEAGDVVEWIMAQEGPVTLYVGCLYWIDLVRKLKGLRDDITIVYDILDSFWDFSDLSAYRNELMSVHMQLLQLADHVLYTSSAMKDMLHGREAHHVRNACWFEQFDIPLNKESPPVVGYAGTIADWFDVEGAMKVVDAGLNLELVGTCSIKLPQKLLDCHIGTVNWDGLAKVMSRWSCGTIMHKMNTLTDRADHTKLYEHMALGIPIVAYPSTSSKYIVNDIVKTNAKDVDLLTLTTDYVPSILYQIEDDSDGKIARRKEWAKKNTWDDRYKQISEIILSTK